MTTTNTTTDETKPTKPARVITPKLQCIVTGKGRLTNKAYLESKASQAGVSTDEYLKKYISREALRLLRQGKTLVEVRQELNSTCTTDIAEAELQAAIKMNGKWGKAE